jgi:class 3 adenylate cyclase/tetratricopeptide (TPR) repeat protein
MSAALHHRMEDVLPSLDGERKVVSVLFADIVRSSDLVAGQDPEDANDHLLPVLQTMIDAVHRFGGTVNQILGDGIMAVFGAPFAQEDHASRACLAAFSMQQSAARLLARHPEPLVRNQAIRVGISSGKVVAQVLRGDLHTEYRIVGEAVYRAARLEKAAAAGSVLICAETLALASDAVDAHSAGNIRVGEDEPPVSAFRLLGVGRRRSQLEARHIVDVPRFVGREDDLGFLDDLWSRARDGHGEVAVVSGEAGVGKSRLVGEFLAAGAAEERRLITCNLHPIGVARASGAMGRIVREALAGTMADAGAVSVRLADYGIRDAMSVRAVLDILDLSRGDPVWQESAPAERLRLAVDAVSRLALALAAEKPLVLVMEDFHWADSRSKAFAAELSARIAEAPILLIVTSRGDQASPWTNWSRVVERRLQPLAPDATAHLLDAMLGTSRAFGGLKQRLIDLTQGVPLFVVECVRSLRQAGAVTGPAGACQLVSDAEIEIPASVHALLAARIDRLVAADRYILLCASVIGSHFDVSLLQDLTGRRPTDLLMHLARLEQAGFVQRTRVMPNLEFSFQHALVHDVAYNTLLKSHRRDLHGRLMTALEGRSAAELPGRVELLSHHAYRAQVWAKAVAYGRLSGRHMLLGSRNVEAVQKLSQAMTALERLPASRRNRERQIDCHLDIIQAHFPLGNQDAIHQHLEQAIPLAEETEDERRIAKLQAYRSLHFWSQGKIGKAISVSKSVLEIARRRADWELEIQIAGRLGAFQIDRGDFESACALLERAITLIPKNQNHRCFGLLPLASVANRAALARALPDLGRFREAHAYGDEAVAIADEHGHAFSQMFANLWAGNAFVMHRQFDRAIPPLERSLDLCRNRGLSLLQARVTSTLGYAYYNVGRRAEGLQLLESTVADAEFRSIRWNYAQQATWLAEVYLHEGLRERAGDMAKRALDAAVASGEKASEAWSLWLMGEVHSALDGTPEPIAHRYLTKAWDMANAHRMGPLLARCHQSLGQFFMRHRAPSKAKGEFEKALSYFSTYGMDASVEDVSRELRLVADRRAQRVH